MGYYIRVLGVKDISISIEDLKHALLAKRLSARFEIDEDNESGHWSLLSIWNSNDIPLVQIERNPVAEGELGKEELEEFSEEIADEKPASAVKWLKKYFTKVKVIYAFQLLSAAFEGDNYVIISTVKARIWSVTRGILQADNEGFSNEDGYHILWQFSDHVSGEWHCAVLNLFGQWRNFKMELGDQQQRADFLAGKVPKNSKPAK